MPFSAEAKSGTGNSMVSRAALDLKLLGLRQAAQELQVGLITRWALRFRLAAAPEPERGALSSRCARDRPTATRSQRRPAARRLRLSRRSPPARGRGAGRPQSRLQPRGSEPPRSEPARRRSEPLQRELLQGEPLQGEPLQGEPLQGEPLRQGPLRREL